MVTDVKTATKTNQRDEIFVPEFGVVNSRCFDPSKIHLGRLYRMSQDVQKQICDALGFTAKFELPAIRTAFMDVFGGAGHLVLEIDRNTKPADISVRYSRERWKVQEVTGKTSEGLRPWIKTEYHAQQIDEQSLSAVAAALQVSVENLDNFLLRCNFRERVFGIITEEQYDQCMPPGSCSVFDLPRVQMPATDTEEVMADDDKSPSPETITTHGSGGASPTADTINLNAATEGATQPMESTTKEEKEMSVETQPQAVENSTNSAPASIEPQQSQPSSDESFVQQTDANIAAPISEPKTEGSSSPASSEPSTNTSSQKSADKKDDFFTKQEPSKREPIKRQQQSAAQRSSDQQYGSERPPYGGSAAQTSPRKDPNYEGQAKYATYSRSEIDYMFKQQAEQILSALSSRVAAQQKAFQESIASQEKTFTKISDNFLTGFDDARIKLENTTKKSQETTHAELEEFHKSLTKELEQYRTQINRVVAPVAKALDDPNKFRQQQKEQRSEAPQKSTGSGNVAHLQKELRVTTALAAASLVVAFAVGAIMVVSLGEVKGVVNQLAVQNAAANGGTSTTTATETGTK